MFALVGLLGIWFVASGRLSAAVGVITSGSAPGAPSTSTPAPTGGGVPPSGQSGGAGAASGGGAGGGGYGVPPVTP
ncbi:MAG: hypothetical protein KGO96_14330 [Elusimicrobia bacterium]|nr:hypothetical protein [Elusimicrobiota bacterium]